MADATATTDNGSTTYADVLSGAQPVDSGQRVATPPYSADSPALAPQVIQPPPDASNLSRSGTAPSVEADPVPEHRSFFSELLHAVGDVFGGPKTAQRVNPQTGAIESVPLSTRQRIAGGIGTALVGAAAGAAQHGPGSVGRAALAGVQATQEQQQRDKENLLSQSANVRATASAAQQQQLTQANLAKISQENARFGLENVALKRSLDQNQVTLLNARQAVLNVPGVKVLQHFDNNDQINSHLETVGPVLAKQYAIDMGKNEIQLLASPDGKGFDAVEIPKKVGQQAVGKGQKLYRVVPDANDPSKLTLETHDADENMLWDDLNSWNGSALSAYNGSLENKQKLADQDQQRLTSQATARKENSEANLADTQARMLVGQQQADPFGNVSKLPQKELLKRQDSFQKDTVNKAYDVEKAFTMSQQAYSEYIAAAKQGKSLPTGAQSMLLLSQHLGTTFGNVKGSRITKDMIESHLGARGITDDAVTAVQRLVNGDQLSSGQWSAFSDLIAQSRNATWGNAISNAKNQQLPITFLPRGNGKNPIDKNTAKLYLDAADGDWQKATAAAQKQGWVVQ